MNIFKKIKENVGIILGSSIITLGLFLGFSGVASATVAFPSQGGTGASTTPKIGQILTGTSAGIYTPTSTINASSVIAAITDSGGQGFSVKAYGAKCDGITDDTAAFVKTWAAAAAVHGTVLLPQGICEIVQNKVSSTVALSMTGVGDGSEVQGIATTTQGTWLFAIANVNYGVFSNFFLSGILSSPSSTVPVNNTFGFLVNTSTNIKVDTVRFENFYEDIEGRTVSSSTFNNLKDYSGFVSSSTSFGTEDLLNIDVLRDSNITLANASCIDTCVRLEGAQRVNVENNQFNYTGLEIGNAEGSGPADTVKVIGNTFSSMSSLAVNMENFSSSTTDTEVVGGFRVGINSVDITGNTYSFNGAFSSSFVLGENQLVSSTNVGVSNVSIQANIAGSTTTSNLSAASAGITAMANGGTAYNWNIKNNTISNVADEAIALFSCVECSVQGNHLINFNEILGGGPGNNPARGSGIRIEGTPTATSSNVSIYGNFIDGNNNNGANGGNNAGRGIYLGSSTNLSAINIWDNPIIRVPNGMVAYADSAPASSTLAVIFQGNFSYGTSTTSTVNFYLGRDFYVAQTSTFGGNVVTSIVSAPLIGTNVSGTLTAVTTSTLKSFTDTFGYLTTSTNNFGGIVGSGTISQISVWNGATSTAGFSGFTYVSSTAIFSAPTGDFSTGIAISTTTLNSPGDAQALQLSINVGGNGHRAIGIFNTGLTAGQNLYPLAMGVSASTNNAGFVQFNYVGSGSSLNNLQESFYGNSASAGLTLQASGNVGIGTTAPSSTLHVVGTFITTGTSTLTGKVGIGAAPGAQLLAVTGGPIQAISQSSGANSYANRQTSLLFNRNDIPTTYFNEITNSWSGTPALTTMNFELANAAGGLASTTLSLNANQQACFNCDSNGNTPSSTVTISGNITLTSSSTVVTPSIGGAIVSGGCDSATTSIDTSVTSSTAAFITTPTGNPGTTLGGTWAYSYLLSSGVIQTNVCSNVSVTPNSLTYIVKIIK